APGTGRRCADRFPSALGPRGSALPSSQPLRTSVKIGLVAAGYVGAFVIASLVVMLYVALTSGPDRHAAQGMYAFGDSLLFLAVFVMAGLPSTGAALFFLRPSRRFWRALSIVAIVVATTGLLALIGYLALQHPALAADLPWWFALSPIRILVAPLFALLFLLAALFAPNRFARIALLAAVVVEGGIFLWVLLIWVRGFRS